MMNTMKNNPATTRAFLLVLGLVSVFGSCFAQEKINYKSDWGERMPSFPNHLVLKGNVVFEHEGMIMLCDSAILNKTENYISAYNNIHIYEDTVHLYGDELFYDGNTKVAEIFGKVVTLHDGKVTLQTDYMLLDRVENNVRYTNKADIWDEDNVLKSRFGTYYIDTKYFEFTDNVEINTPNAFIQSDSVAYDSRSHESYFFAWTDIFTTDSVRILTTKGQYNTETEDAVLRRDNCIIRDSKTLKADSILYNTKKDVGKAFFNVTINDTANDIMTRSDYLELDKKDSLPYAFLTGRLCVMQTEKEDTLYMHGDTLWVDFDTAMHAKELMAYAHAKVFKKDVQLAAEMIHYFVDDSLAFLTVRPVMWNEENQFTADTIVLTVAEGGIKSMRMYPNSFIVQNSDTATEMYFNQVSGRVFDAEFEDSRIAYAQMQGNVRTIYHFWEEDKDKKQLTGINIGSSVGLKMYFKKGKLEKMTAVDKPEFYLDDKDRIKEEDKTLKGFIWLESQRPLSPQDIFKHRD